jgi:hypothetical protein
MPQAKALVFGPLGPQKLGGHALSLGQGPVMAKAGAA